MSDTPASDDDTYEAPPADALPVGTGITGIDPQPDDGPQPDQDPHYEAEDSGRVGATTSLTATRVLNEARSHLGFREGRNNDNPWWKWPPFYTWLRFASYCASAASYCFYRVGGAAGLAAIHGGHYNCAEWRSSAQRYGQWHPTGPRAGDLALFDWSGAERNPEHVGIVESFTASTVTCIEFNTSSGTGGSQSDGGGCYRRTRNRRYVVGYVRPNYGGTVVIVPTNNPTNTGTKKIALTVDGDWGPNTTRRLQQYMSIGVDGDLGPATRKALQRLVGVTADGAWGPATRKALQKLVKVTQDGQWGPMTIKAFQRYLNVQGLHRRVTVAGGDAGTGGGLVAAVVAWIKALLGGLLSKDGRPE